jgi:hypothetical protein
VPVALLSAPPVTPFTLNRDVAFVPVEVETEAGAVPASVKPVVEPMGSVKVASAVGLIKPVALLSKLIAPPLVVVAQVAQAIVPVVVIVPPVIGEVVAMLVTPAPPLRTIAK